MTYVLRQTTQRAGGGEIIRTKQVDSDDLIVGRGADCDLQLADLAVALRHLRVRIQPQGGISLLALGDQGFELGGRFERSAELSLDVPQSLILGGHTLRLAAGTDLRVVEVSVVGASSATGPNDLEDDLRKLAPAAAGWSKRKLAWGLGLGILMACLLVPIAGFLSHHNAKLGADRQWSSGPLSASHAFLSKDCQSCHQKAFAAVRDEACLTCHASNTSPRQRSNLASELKSRGALTPIRLVAGHAPRNRLQDGSPGPIGWIGWSLRATELAANHPQGRCASCHLEHVDESGVRRKASADTHPAAAKPVLDARLNCSDCHAKLKGRLADTDLGNVGDWAGHPEFRPQVWNGGSRVRVQRSAGGTEANGLIFPHAVHLAPTGTVARLGQVLGKAQGYGGALDCGSCHRPMADGRGFAPIKMARDCGSCHSLAFAERAGKLVSLPHERVDHVVGYLDVFFGKGSPQVGATLAAAFGQGGVCRDCHVARPSQGPLGWVVTPVHLSDRFLSRGAFDHGVRDHHVRPDGSASCSDCHKAQASKSSSDLLMPGKANCVTCHKDAPKAPARADCETCHSYHNPGRASVAPQIQWSFKAN
jgi:predicted CXXCH cytochrome family protein